MASVSRSIFKELSVYEDGGETLAVGGGRGTHEHPQRTQK